MSKARLLNQEYRDSILSRAEVQSKCIRPGRQRHCTNSTESALLCMDQGSIAGWDLQIPSLAFVLFIALYWMEMVACRLFGLMVGIEVGEGNFTIDFYI